MFRYALIKTSRVLAVSALPLAAAVVFAGASSAYTGQAAAAAPTATVVAQPIAGLPLEDVTTNPDAQYPDPVLNGAAAGAAIGSATGSFIDPVPTLLGAVIGGIIGSINPGVIPQVLP